MGVWEKNLIFTHSRRMNVIEKKHILIIKCYLQARKILIIILHGNGDTD